jgi:diadenosine tetraphosphate (Ap4A) HIT family hydrolase
MEMNCILCDKIEAIKKNEFKFIIQEFKNSYWILGDHQFFKGYSQIILKDHIRDLFELSESKQIELYQELMLAEKASRLFLNPWKMNLSLYGNAVPHIHWHLFPRYQEEEDCKKVPWYFMEKFDSKPTNQSDYEYTIKNLRERL